MELTATNILAATLRFNAGHVTLDETEAIKQGSPGVDVRIHADRKGGKVRAIATPGIRTADGFYAADIPQVTRVRPTRNFDYAAIRAWWGKRTHPGLPVLPN